MSTTTMTVLLPLMAQHLVSVDAFTSTSAHRGVKITSLCGECQQPELLSPFRRHSKTECATTALAMSGEPSSEGSKQQLPFYLDPNTKGGALVLMVVLFVVPYLAYQVMVSPTFGLGMDEIDAGITVGMGFTIVSMLAWVSTYIFRVATKDMTYVRIMVVVVVVVVVVLLRYCMSCVHKALQRVEVFLQLMLLSSHLLQNPNIYRPSSSRTMKMQ
jgi:Protein of unknown function (DUF3007)